MSTNLLRRLAAIAKAALEIVMKLLGIPMRIVGGLLGGGGVTADHQLAAARDLAADLRADVEWENKEVEMLRQRDLDAARRATARAVWRWSAGSVLDGATAVLPPRLPRSVGAWLPGLDYAAIFALANAGAEAVKAHISGISQIPGVPAVAPLSPVVVRYPPPPAADAPPREIKRAR